MWDYQGMMWLATGVVAATIIYSLLKERANLVTALLVTAFSVLSGYFGARLLYLLLYPPETGLFFSQLLTFKAKNFTLYGGVVASALSFWILLKTVKLPVLKIADRAFLGCAVGLLISRFGCVLNGCCYGKITTVPWSISMKKGSLAYASYIQTHPVGFFTPLPNIHFTQGYELLVIVIASVVGIVVFREKKRPQYRDGLAVISFALTMTVGRFIVFCFRDFPFESAQSLLMRGPVVYTLTITVLLILSVYILHFFEKDTISIEGDLENDYPQQISHKGRIDEKKT